MPPNISLGAPATEQPAAEGSLLPDAEQTWQHAVISMLARPSTRALRRFTKKPRAGKLIDWRYLQNMLRVNKRFCRFHRFSARLSRIQRGAASGPVPTKNAQRNKSNCCLDSYISKKLSETHSRLYQRRIFAITGKYFLELAWQSRPD